MTSVSQTIPELRNVDPDTFRNEIFPQNKPVVLRGAVDHWPAVQAGRQSTQAMCDYIKRFDLGRPLDIMVGPAAIGGRFFYQEDLQGFNFKRETSQLGEALDRIMAQRAAAEPASVFVQSAPIQHYLPAFEAENAFALPGASSAPRIWIGNSVIVAAHFDLSYNIACVVAGRRRFTLFPPEQLPNLYVSPMENTPAGTPISMVSLEAPDFERFPRFKHALEAAQSAELGPGDAIYIPYCWWHHVRSLEHFNVLVNYWWNDVKSWVQTPFASLMHAVLGLRDLPPDQRAAWRIMFDYYVFRMEDEDPLAHLPPEQRGALGPMTPERARYLTQLLQRSLVR
jgi:Cupin-like domain